MIRVELMIVVMGVRRRDTDHTWSEPSCAQIFLVAIKIAVCIDNVVTVDDELIVSAPR